MMSPSEPGLMISIDLGFKVGVQDTAPAAILLASVRPDWHFRRNRSTFGKHGGRTFGAATPQRVVQPNIAFRRRFYLPIASRSARSRGKPASAIFLCTAARSYFMRNCWTRLFSVSYAVFCLKKKNNMTQATRQTVMRASEMHARH